MNWNARIFVVLALSVSGIRRGVACGSGRELLSWILMAFRIRYPGSWSLGVGPTETGWRRYGLGLMFIRNRCST